MRLFFSVAIAAASFAATSAGAIPVPLSAKVAGPQSIPGTGLAGRFYNQDISNAVAAHQPGALGTPDGTFVSSRINYEQGSDGRSVVEFLGNDGDSFEGADPGSFASSVLTFDGFINITDDLDMDEDTDGIQTWFALGSDDGFDLVIGGVGVGSAGVRAYQISLLPVEFMEAGLYSFSLLYFENSTDSGLSFGRPGEGVFPLSSNAFFQSVPESEEVPEPAMLGLFGLGALGLAASRRRR